MKREVFAKYIDKILFFIIPIFFFAASPLSAQHSYNVISSFLDGELKSKGSVYGYYEVGDKNVNRGALGGGARGYEWVINSSKSPSKRGAVGAIDGQPDIGGTSKGNTFTTTVLADSIRIGQRYTTNYEIFKGFLSFDTSGIPYDAIITAATLTIYGKAKNIDSGEENFNIRICDSCWTEPLWNPDWGALSGIARGSLNTSNFLLSQNNIITISALNANYFIEKGGTTKIALLSSRTSNAEEPTGDEYVEIYSSNAEDPDMRPKLNITYIGDAPNIRPSLNWTGEQYYKMNGVYPEEIQLGENDLVFRVQYINPLGVAPFMTQVWIDLNSDSDFYDPGEKVDMSEVDQSDTDYSNGKNYYADVTLNSDGVSEIQYRFVFTDENDTEVIGTPSQIASLLTIPIEPEKKEPKSQHKTISYYSQLIPNLQTKYWMPLTQQPFILPGFQIEGSINTLSQNWYSNQLYHRYQPLYNQLYGLYNLQFQPFYSYLENYSGSSQYAPYNIQFQPWNQSRYFNSSNNIGQFLNNLQLKF